MRGARKPDGQDQRVLDVLLRPGWHPMSEFWHFDPPIIHVPRRIANLLEKCPGCGGPMNEIKPPPEGLKRYCVCGCGATMSKRVAQKRPLIEAWRLDLAGASVGGQRLVGLRTEDPLPRNRPAPSAGVLFTAHSHGWADEGR